jgi:hypothetical protein
MSIEEKAFGNRYCKAEHIDANVNTIVMSFLSFPRAAGSQPDRVPLSLYPVPPENVLVLASPPCSVQHVLKLGTNPVVIPSVATSRLKQLPEPIHCQQIVWFDKHRSYEPL